MLFRSSPVGRAAAATVAGSAFRPWAVLADPTVPLPVDAPPGLRFGDLALSLIAEVAGRIAGHIAFSRVTISDGAREWYDLGPVSVWPELHHRGIGSALIRQGIADLRTRGAAGIVLLGSPAYYSRFGFRHEPQLRYPGPPPEYFQCLVLTGELPEGEVRYAPAFRKP